MTIRIPLRWAGGKSRALKALDAFFPLVCDEYREPFLGGGSVALHVSAKHPGASIWVNDVFRANAAFWQTLKGQADAVRLVDALLDLHAQTRTELKARAAFTRARAKMFDEHASIHEAAVSLYYFNRCSFSGTASSGFVKDSWARWRASESRIKDLLTYTPLIGHWRVTNLDYAKVIASPWAGRAPFCFMDPPYQLERRGGDLYADGGGFDQARFQECAEAMDVPCLITLNAELQRSFSLWPTKKLWRLEYTLRSDPAYRVRQKSRHELLLANYTLGGRRQERRQRVRLDAQKFSPERLLALFDHLGFSQADAADALGVTDRAVRFWLSGQRQPRGPAMKLLHQLEAKCPPARPGARLRQVIDEAICTEA